MASIFARWRDRYGSSAKKAVDCAHEVQRRRRPELRRCPIKKNIRSFPHTDTRRVQRDRAMGRRRLAENRMRPGSHHCDRACTTREAVTEAGVRDAVALQLRRSQRVRAHVHERRIAFVLFGRRSSCCHRDPMIVHERTVHIEERAAARHLHLLISPNLPRSPQ